MINHFPNSFAIAAQQGHSHPSYAGGGGVHIIQIRNYKFPVPGSGPAAVAHAAA
jgi:hypothetical protein